MQFTFAALSVVILYLSLSFRNDRDKWRSLAEESAEVSRQALLHSRDVANKTAILHLDYRMLAKRLSACNDAVEASNAALHDARIVPFLVEVDGSSGTMKAELRFEAVSP